MTAASIDVLARVESATVVTFWRPFIPGDDSTAAEQFGTGRDWTEITGGSLDEQVGNVRAISTIRVDMTAFKAPGAPNVVIKQVHTDDTSIVVWTLDTGDPVPSSPTYASPAYPTSGSAVVFTAVLVVDSTEHSLDIKLTPTTYSPPPTGPILIGDDSTPNPNPVG